MRLPRRVPWASISELEQVCSWIYNDENDYEAKSLAINRLSAWKAITPLPHALDSTLAILVVVNQDRFQTQGATLPLRQSYATAIIRLVNGLVDPLQLGAFARSIASIAKQLGLPSWLVELRHAATHEELPSLPVLREAARQSLSWLLHNYFLPTLNPLSSTSPVSTSLRPLKPILKQYKEYMKTVTRDASLAAQYKPRITSLMKDVERWIAEAEVAANISMDAVGWGSSHFSDAAPQEQDIKERWALERFCDDLLEKGGLVPLSKKKRLSQKDRFWPPAATIAIWAPLLQNLQDLHADFASVLSQRICSYLLALANPDPSEDHIPLESLSDPSYEMCLARWVLWLIEVCTPQGSQDYDLRQEAVTALLRGLSSAFASPTKAKSSAMQLLEVLCEGQPELHAALELLRQSAPPTQRKDWSPSDINVMQDRLNLLQQEQTLLVSVDKMETSTEGRVVSSDSAGGWRQLSRGNWRPCPIGIFISSC
ncbi:LAS1 [Coprinopsis cinerea AmutBmut pab1-1]|nr:LAS1 [Coprinopsis cinerea AmutBmut pab1-1]